MMKGRKMKMAKGEMGKEEGAVLANSVSPTQKEKRTSGREGCGKRERCIKKSEVAGLPSIH
jgi:hypothetical protein